MAPGQLVTFILKKSQFLGNDFQLWPSCQASCLCPFIPGDGIKRVRGMEECISWSSCPCLHYWVITITCQVTQISLVMFTFSSKEDTLYDSHEDMKCQRDPYNQRLDLCQEGWVESCATCKGFLNVYSNLLPGYIWLLWVGTATILFNSGSSNCRRNSQGL